MSSSAFPHSIASCPVSTHAIVLTDRVTGRVLSASEAAHRVLRCRNATPPPVRGRSLVGRTWDELVVKVETGGAELQQQQQQQQQKQEPHDASLEQVMLLRILNSGDNGEEEEEEDEREEDEEALGGEERHSTHHHDHHHHHHQPDCRYLQACGHGIEDDDGSPLYVLWFLDDVTHVRDLSKAVEVDAHAPTTTSSSSKHSHNSTSTSTAHDTSSSPPPHTTDSPTHAPGETQTIVIRLNTFGRILQSFPMTSFLGNTTQSLLNRFIMRFVVQEDVPELCRGLSRACRPFGYAVFMVRWTWTGWMEAEGDDDDGDDSAADASTASGDEMELDTTTTLQSGHKYEQPHSDADDDTRTAEYTISDDEQATTHDDDDDMTRDDAEPVIQPGHDEHLAEIEAYIASRVNSRRGSLASSSETAFFPLPTSNPEGTISPSSGTILFPSSSTSSLDPEPPLTTQQQQQHHQLNRPPPAALSRRQSITELPLNPQHQTHLPRHTTSSTSLTNPNNNNASSSPVSAPTTPAPPPPPTWVHFTVGPCPTPGNDTPDPHDPSRHLLCLVQIVRATPPATPNSDRAGTTTNTTTPTALPPRSDDTCSASDSESDAVSFFGGRGWIDTWRDRGALLTTLARRLVATGVWILWRVCTLPTILVAQLGGLVVSAF